VRASAEALASMSDSDCRRFLRARNHDVEKAADMARNALDWSLLGAGGTAAGAAGVAGFAKHALRELCNNAGFARDRSLEAFTFSRPCA
jgi:hypothetical protein